MNPGSDSKVHASLRASPRLGPGGDDLVSGAFVGGETVGRRRWLTSDSSPCGVCEVAIAVEAPPDASEGAGALRMDSGVPDAPDRACFSVLLSLSQALVCRSVTSLQKELSRVVMRGGMYIMACSSSCERRCALDGARGVWCGDWSGFCPCACACSTGGSLRLLLPLSVRSLPLRQLEAEGLPPSASGAEQLEQRWLRLPGGRMWASAGSALIRGSRGWRCMMSEKRARPVSFTFCAPRTAAASAARAGCSVTPGQQYWHTQQPQQQTPSSSRRAEPEVQRLSPRAVAVAAVAAWCTD